MSSQQLPSHDQICEAVKAVARALGSTTKYAIVGGSACAILGSPRLTSDVDFVVLKGETKAARALLKQDQDHFEVVSRTRHTTFKCTPPIEVEILAPPGLFKGEFTESTPVLEIDGIKVLNPVLLLDCKCGSILTRHNDEKKATDADDIQFLLEWCAKNEVRPTASQLPHVTKEFVTSFTSVWGNENLWEDAGYNIEKGIWEE